MVGVSGYHESLGALPYCAADARLVRDTLVSDVCGFPRPNVLLLTDDEPQDRQPTYGNIHSWLTTWLRRPSPDDLLVVYFSCHGRETDDGVMLAPLDATLDSLPATGIPFLYVYDSVCGCRARRKVLILDTCHSGAGRDIEGMSPKVRGWLEHEEGLYGIASCDSHEVAYDWPEKGHGAFTWYLAEAIREGAPTQPNGDVTLDAVFAWTQTKVSNWAASRRLTQTPVRHCEGVGRIVLASRSHTLSRRLSSAQEQLAERDAEIERLEAECEMLRARLRAAGGEKVVLARRVVPPTHVPEWREWAGSRAPGLVTSVFMFLFMAVVLGVPVGLGSLGVSALFRLPHPFLTAGCLALGLPGLYALGRVCSYAKWRNRYRLLCAQICAEAGDYVGGASYAVAMTRAGVDRAAGGAVLVRLANLALEQGDAACARRLYRRARWLWRSPYAREALKALPARVDARPIS